MQQVIDQEQWLRVFRELHGWTKTEAARQAGLPPTTWLRWESGERPLGGVVRRGLACWMAEVDRRRHLDPTAAHTPTRSTRSTRLSASTTVANNAPALVDLAIVDRADMDRVQLEVFGAIRKPRRAREPRAVADKSDVDIEWDRKALAAKRLLERTTAEATAKGLSQNAMFDMTTLVPAKDAA